MLTNVAAVVTQLLPNANMVIEGKQEVRLNSELRELIVAGVVRPEDIESDNNIGSNNRLEKRGIDNHQVVSKKKKKVA